MSSGAQSGRKAFAVAGDLRSPYQILADIIKKGQRHVAEELRQATDYFDRSYLKQDVHFVLIAADEFEQEDCVAARILQRAEELKLKEPSQAAALLFADTFPQKQLGFSKIIIFCRPGIYIPRPENPSNTHGKAFLLSSGLQAGKLDLIRKNRGKNRTFVRRGLAFAFCT